MGKLIDLTNKKFGRLTVVQRGNNIGKATAWLCKCDCGKDKVLVRSDHLRSGAIQSCGCLQKETFSIIARKNKKDLSGQVFNKLTVIKEVEEERYCNGIIWYCQCECGNTVKVPAIHLVNKHCGSCGCDKSSRGEQKIIEILKANSIQYIKEKCFSDQLFSDTGAHGRYDFYLPNENRLIEFDGAQHYKEKAIWNKNTLHFEQLQLHDKEKNEYALSHNIPLVRIPYWERDNITLEMIMGDQYIVPNSAQPTV